MHFFFTAFLDLGRLKTQNRPLLIVSEFVGSAPFVYVAALCGVVFQSPSKFKGFCSFLYVSVPLSYFCFLPLWATAVFDKHCFCCSLFCCRCCSLLPCRFCWAQASGIGDFCALVDTTTYPGLEPSRELEAGQFVVVRNTPFVIGSPAGEVCGVCVRAEPRSVGGGPFPLGHRSYRLVSPVLCECHVP